MHLQQLQQHKLLKNKQLNAANAAVTSAQSTNGGIVLSNGNTAGEVGSYAAARMAEMTGVPASTWEAIIARESNGQVNAANPSGAKWSFPNNARLGFNCYS